MYEKYYGLKSKPFHIIPSSNTLYLSNKHQSALTYLEYGITENVGFILLTGEIGTGKTTLIRYMLKKIDTEMEVAVIFNTTVSPEQLLKLILTEFEIPYSEDKAKSLDILNQFLIDKYSEGKRVLLIIDEAQNLSNEALEEIRMLSNLQSDEQMLLQIMLVGQPELKRKLQSPKLKQLTQRIAVNYHLTALTEEETKNYIQYRLERAGGNIDLFTKESMEIIHQASGGIPRSINLYCDSALVYGFADELSIIDKHIVEQVIQDKGDMVQTGTGGDSASSNPSPIMGKAVDQHVVERMANLENDVRKLQIQMDWYVSEMEKKANTYKDDLVLRFKELLHQERKRNGKLIKELTRIKEKYETLQKNSVNNPQQIQNQKLLWEDLGLDEEKKKEEKSRHTVFSWLKA